MPNRVFFPQPMVDEWLLEGRIDLLGAGAGPGGAATELALLGPGRRFAVVEAVRIVAEVTGANDQFKLVGKVKSKVALEQLGAEILENSMILGDNAYDVVPGWAGTPSTPFAEFLASVEGGRSDAPRTEEDLLQRFARGEGGGKS